MDFFVFILCCVVRLFSVYAVQTFFSPDEFWQSLEVAHRLSFGYGHLTWEWSKGIRSYFHPAVISLIYKLLAHFNLDSVSALIILPRVLQASISGFADYRFYRWCNRGKWALFITLTSWFWFYTGSRTLINTLECSMITIALSYFPWNKSENTGFLWYFGTLAFIRPTSIITTIPFCVHHIRTSRFSIWELILKRYLFIGIIIATALINIDSYYHGSWLITPLEFFKSNVIDDIGAHYGTHPFHWYLSSGLTAVLGIGCVPFFLAVLQTASKWNEFEDRKPILISIASTIFIYSFVSHKEFRFLLQILPLCLYLISKYLSEWSRKQSKITIWVAAMVIFVANAIPAGYLGHVHQQGTLNVMGKIADIAHNYQKDEGTPPKIFFMMPCHSTPFYSHVHKNVSLRFLSCEPNFSKLSDYTDEADLFHEAPMKWIRNHLPARPVEALPTHVVVFDSLVPRIGDFLSIYQKAEVFFHSDYLVSVRGGKNVIIFERISPADRSSKKKNSEKAEVKEPVTNEEL